MCHMPCAAVLGSPALREAELSSLVPHLPGGAPTTKQIKGPGRGGGRGIGQGPV